MLFGIIEEYKLVLSVRHARILLLITYVCVCVRACRLKNEMNNLEQQKRLLYNKLIKNSIYHMFMTRVLDSAADFHEIRGIISRFDTLYSTCQVMQ